jgi:GT2 family glycosyltransferase
MGDSPKAPDLSIIIITWNSREFLVRCLDSLDAGGLSHEVIVVDNASEDGTAGMVRRDYPHVVLLGNARNIGMPARNQGLRRAKGKYLLLLDVDTIVRPGALRTLVDYLRAHPDVGLVAAKLTDEDGALQYTCHKFPTVVSKALRRYRFGWAEGLLKEVEFRDWDHGSIRDVDYVTGACQMIRREAYERVGPIDSRIFYGPEDVDYCLRVWQAGYRVTYNPEAVIVHAERRVTAKSWFRRTTWEHVKGLAYYFLKHRYFLSRDKVYRTIPYYSSPSQK